MHEVWDSLVIPVCKQWPTEWPFKTASRSCKRSVYTYVFHLSRITITFYRDAWHHESANIDGRQDDFVRIYFSKKKKIVRIFVGEGKKKFLFALINCNFINAFVNTTRYVKISRVVLKRIFVVIFEFYTICCNIILRYIQLGFCYSLIRIVYLYLLIDKERKKRERSLIFNW